VAARLTRPRRPPLVGFPAVYALVALVVAGCGASGGGRPVVTFPPGSVGPDATVSPAVAQTEGSVAAALAGKGFQLVPATGPVRPAESASLVTAPRAVYQVATPTDAAGPFVSIYEFRDPGAASDAGREMAAWLGTGPGRVQTPIGTHHVIRGVGSTLILYSWTPGAGNDQDDAAIEAALSTLGSAFDVPS
jgi:hypothetical protein